MIDALLIDVIIILFPILVNILHELYVKNSDKDADNLFLDVTLISSLYLLIVLNKNMNVFTILINIIFLLSLLKKRTLVSLIIFISIIINYKLNNMPNLIIISGQYVIYYILYLLFYKSKKENLFIKYFIITKILFIFIFHISIKGVYALNIINSILISIIFSLILYLVIYIIKISEDIVRLHMNIKELENNKQIQDSLFKITHEIKNPIAVCKSYLDMFDINNIEHEKYIDILKEEMENILVLLQDFSSMSKIQIKREILDINLLLEDVSRQLGPILRSDNINFITNISLDEIYIEGDYNRLSQVLTNIIKNSKEAKDESKKSFISLKTNIEENNFIIIIEDNGIGISLSDIEKIKEPFYTTKKNGTGLGVSLSIRIIEAHNGKIDYISKDGVGTKVVISLPLRREF
jgi:two-component system sporulation sensor kinase B